MLSARRDRERARLLLGICRALDGHAAKGHPLLPQFRKFARRYAGAVYRCDISCPLKISAQTLKRIYYSRWLRSGRKQEALRHRYGQNAKRFKLRRSQRRLLPFLFQKHGSLSAVFRAIYATAKRGTSHCVFRRTFTAEERQFLCKLFVARRQVAARERHFHAWVSNPDRTFAIAKGKKS